MDGRLTAVADAAAVGLTGVAGPDEEGSTPKILSSNDRLTTARRTSDEAVQSGGSRRCESHQMRQEQLGLSELEVTYPAVAAQTRIALVKNGDRLQWPMSDEQKSLFASLNDKPGS
ncbi:hypothetical protein [Streptomyces sp. NBC_01268]|uniref:hypothetical protein n=1 Tax=Streptomyces sp. NBC_01268 TaxID=2903806 RepID=UPI002E30644A|nr:hypothetical protein [Streptomyces sp. NBC_01268]